MIPQTLVRALVSTPKNAFHDIDEYLDLTYITPRLIVAAGPTDRVLTTFFRSPVDRIVSHLNRYYTTGDEPNWHIWNLRGEGPGYKLDLFTRETWTFHPFPDHEPPSIPLMYQIVEELDYFLARSPKNVALVHCNEGKGRSGTICCAYLMYEAKKRGLVLTVDQAIDLFTKRRMRRLFGAGVSVVSQIKYLGYWERFLSMGEALRADLFTFHFAGVGYDHKKSMFTHLTVFNPASVLALSRLNVSTYVEDGRGLATAVLRSSKFPSLHARQYLAYDVPLNLPLHPRTRDVRISFEQHICIAYTWFSLYFETSGASSPGIFTQEGKMVSRRLVIPWSSFDGIRGTRVSKACRLFDRVEISWVFHLG